MPEISIILPCKNGASFLEETLHSIHKQSYEDWECIMVDDNSTDSSWEIMGQFSKLDERFSALKNSGKGVISALQCGYAHSKGNLITRMDADDLMPNDKLEQLRNELLKAGKGTVATGKVKYFNTLGEGFIQYQNWLNKLIDQDSHWSQIYKECVIASPNWMIHRSDFDKIGGFNQEVYPEDYDLVFRMKAGGLKVKSTSEVTHLWRDHETRASRTSELYADNRFIPLKVNWFHKIDYNPEKRPVLLGAGKKGKAVAKELNKLEIPFSWITNNPKKIGHEIYGVVLGELDNYKFAGSQLLLAVSSPEDVLHIKNEFESSEGRDNEYFELF